MPDLEWPDLYIDGTDRSVSSLHHGVCELRLSWYIESSILRRLISSIDSVNQKQTDAAEKTRPRPHYIVSANDFLSDTTIIVRADLGVALLRDTRI